MAFGVPEGDIGVGMPMVNPKRDFELLAANVPEEEARAAAEVRAAEFGTFIRRVDRQFTRLQWMLALNLAMEFAIFLKLCVH